MTHALTIAGSDSGGGAGIQADLKTFAAFGVFGTSAITAITAQNTLGVTASLPLPTEIITKQIEAIVSDIGVQAAKTGMLATTSIVETVAAALQSFDILKVVVDPVMIAKSGAPLLGKEALVAVRTKILPCAHVVTPNIMEAEILSERSIRSMEDVKDAALRIHELGPTAVLIKGGHLTGQDAIDVLYDGQSFTELKSVRLDSQNTHGTGCTLSAAIAASLAKGHTLVSACHLAKSYVTEAIRNGFSIGQGYGALHHLWASGTFPDSIKPSS